jgi:serine/threonine-protein phosphatase with EF-hand domain
MTKYKDSSSALIHLLDDIFAWFPLATVVDRDIFISHGGISDKTDIDFLQRLPRQKVAFLGDLVKEPHFLGI